MRETLAAAADRGHESSLFSTSRIAWFSAGLVLLIGLTALLSIALVGGFRLPRPPTSEPPQVSASEPPPVPQLQSEPASDLRAYRRDKEEMLHGYHWIDRRGGRLQIPIERAMQLMAERRAPSATPPSQPEVGR